MNSIKAVGIGCLFIIILGLLAQLAYIFIAVGYVELAKNWPFLNQITGYFRYTVAVPVFFLIMFMGGYITTAITKQKALLHCFVVGVITLAIMIAPLLDEREFTTSGIVVFILALLSTMVGGVVKLKREVR